MEINQSTPSKSLTIGVLLGSFEEPCQSQIIKGLTYFAQINNIHLITFVGASIDETQKYLGSYQALHQLIDASSLDALIMMSGAIANLLTLEEIEYFVSSFSPLPIISISMPIKGCTNLLLDNETGITHIVEHLIKEHQCKRIGFVCGPKNHDEADTRLHAYKKTLTKYHIPIDDTIIFPGDFSIASGKNAVDTLVANHITDLDALVCVDDLTAYGALQASKSYDIKVPFDLRITGFDDSFESQTCFPPLTTVKQPFYDMGMKAGNIALQLLHQQVVPSTIYIRTETVLRESCGCIEENILDVHIQSDINRLLSDTVLSSEELLSFILTYFNTQTLLTDQQEHYIIDFIKEHISHITDDTLVLSEAFWYGIRHKVFYLASCGIQTSLLKQMTTFIHGYFNRTTSSKSCYKFKYITQRFTNIIDDINASVVDLVRREDYLFDFKLSQISQKLIASFDTESVLDSIASGLKELGIPSCYIALFNTPDAKKCSLRLHFAYRNGHRLTAFENQEFSSCYLISPELPLSIFGITHIVMPLLPTQNVFGYIIFQYTAIAHNVFETLRSHIGSGLHGALLYEKEKRSQKTLQRLLVQLEQNNTQLKTTSIQDELTSLYNRRGFMELASEHFDSLCNQNGDCILYFIDLDGLKKINDTYGHLEGDDAIIQTANLLRHTFGNHAYVARLGGDEFTVFITADTHTSPLSFIELFNHLLRSYNATSNKPYLLSASFGYARYGDHKHISFRGLLNLADLQLYKEKQKKYKFKEQQTT